MAFVQIFIMFHLGKDKLGIQWNRNKIDLPARLQVILGIISTPSGR